MGFQSRTRRTCTMSLKRARAPARRVWANPARVSRLAVPNGKAKRQFLEKKMNSRLCYQNLRRKVHNHKVCNIASRQSADCSNPDTPVLGCHNTCLVWVQSQAGLCQADLIQRFACCNVPVRHRGVRPCNLSFNT